jgi:hypothetical protein
MSLSDYVRFRNGVALGVPGSLSNMLKRSVGAGSFAAFWRYWNPIWGYYLSRLIMRPLARFLPTWLAIILTFVVSGASHDLAVSLVRWQPTLFITPWFALMGATVVVTEGLGITYHQRAWAVRAMANTSLIAACLGLTYWLTAL